MAAGTRDIARFEAEYLTGRNPLAYIPLCQALRRERRFAEALEHCQRGLESTPDSAAGRSLLVRLLTDLGRYEPALREVERAERLAPPSKSLKVAKARALGNLGKIQMAMGILAELERDHLLDPEVQILSQDLKALSVERASDQVRLPPEAQEPRRPAKFVSMEDLVGKLREGLAPLGLIHTLGVIDLDSGKSCVEGVQGYIDSADVLFQEVATACHDLDGGILSSTLIETQRALMITVRRQRRLVVVAVDPTIAHAGRFLLRTMHLLDQVCPEIRRGADAEVS
jgi:tetratricopeptide (TPR) repeat protein